MHETAHDEGHELSALVLLGPKQRQLKEKLPTNDRLIVLVKPIKMKDVQDALAQLAPIRRMTVRSQPGGHHPLVLTHVTVRGAERRRSVAD